MCYKCKIAVISTYAMHSIFVAGICSCIVDIWPNSCGLQIADFLPIILELRISDSGLRIADKFVEVKEIKTGTFDIKFQDYYYDLQTFALHHRIYLQIFL